VRRGLGGEIAGLPLATSCVVRIVLASWLLVACGGGAEPPSGGDLPLGDLSADDAKADGDWGYALQCKPIPVLAPLTAPRITVSIDGLTLHLSDAPSGYDRVFPIGPGQIDLTQTDSEYRESLSYEPLIRTGNSDFAITPSSSTPCKTWWTDPDTGEQLPVFAGLPFMSWYGNYAIHGPIDNYRAANGGALRRGYVSHGCIRMQAADVLEVYARVRGAASVPVHVQRAPERAADGTTIDVPAKWIGSPCQTDGECAFADGFCASNPLDGRGFCSAHCDGLCADRAGYPTTFCVTNPASTTQGMCVPRAQSVDFECRPYDQFAVQSAARFAQPDVIADACVPHSPGWIGDHCLADADCRLGTTCFGATGSAPGICSMACTALCPDQPGWATTFCAQVPALSTDGVCVRSCTPSSNGAECPGDMACRSVPRNAQPTAMRYACTAS
jgi:hypothetical protein